MNYGRVVIPVEIRQKYNIVERDLIGIYVEGNKILLQKLIPECIFCENRTDLIEYNDKYICKICLNKIQEIKCQTERKVK